VKSLCKCICIAYPAVLRAELEKNEINTDRIARIIHQEEEEAELEEIEVKQMSAVELMPIVRAKGLSADHVFVIGFDNVNMRWITRNAFYVAMTRARNTLHLITALKSGGASGPSDYLDHLPNVNLEFSKYTKSDRTRTALPNREAYVQYFKNLDARRFRRR
jgi:superfamily I DNA/RNA helicase